MLKVEPLYKAGNIYIIESSKFLIVNNCDLSLAEVKSRKYDRLLSTIAVAFGFDSIDSRDLVKHVLADAIKHYASIQEFDSAKIWLSKLMVHKCISKLGSDIFASTSLRPCPAAAKLTVHDMPLTLRAVFILQHSVGFNELEVAEILNSSAYIVRRRLNRALELLKIYG